MAIHAVSFSHKLGEERYDAFFQILEDLGPNICLFDGCYLVNSVLTAKGISKQLLPLIAADDRLLITRLTTDGVQSAGRLTPRIKQWIREHQQL